jgi:hypothetical protein
VLNEIDRLRQIHNFVAFAEILLGVLHGALKAEELVARETSSLHLARTSRRIAS